VSEQVGLYDQADLYNQLVIEHELFSLINIMYYFFNIRNGHACYENSFVWQCHMRESEQKMQ